MYDLARFFFLSFFSSSRLDGVFSFLFIFLFFSFFLWLPSIQVYSRSRFPTHSRQGGKDGRVIFYIMTAFSFLFFFDGWAGWLGRTAPHRTAMQYFIFFPPLPEARRIDQFRRSECVEFR